MTGSGPKASLSAEDRAHAQALLATSGLEHSLILIRVEDRSCRSQSLLLTTPRAMLIALAELTQELEAACQEPMVREMFRQHKLAYMNLAGVSEGLPANAEGETIQ